MILFALRYVRWKIYPELTGIGIRHHNDNIIPVHQMLSCAQYKISGNNHWPYLPMNSAASFYVEQQIDFKFSYKIMNVNQSSWSRSNRSKALDAFVWCIALARCGECIYVCWAVELYGSWTNSQTLIVDCSVLATFKRTFFTLNGIQNELNRHYVTQSQQHHH